MTPHKHAEVIKKWADGAKIRGRAFGTAQWEGVKHPAWLDNWEYEVVPPRVFPTTSLTAEELLAVVRACKGNFEDSYVAMANAAIQRHIEDTEKST